MTAARRRWRPAWAGAAILLLAGVAAGLVIDYRLGPKHLMTVTPGVLYRSGQLTPEQLAEVVAEHDIRTVVNLRSENERRQGDWYDRQAELLGELGVGLVDLPMNTGFPPRDEVRDGWLELLDRDEAQPVLVHCEYGVIRTGIMVAIYQIERLGLSAEAALSRFERFGDELPETIQGRIDDYFGAYVPRRSQG